jgi:hypothetical protein
MLSQGIGTFRIVQDLHKTRKSKKARMLFQATTPRVEGEAMQ